VLVVELTDQVLVGHECTDHEIVFHLGCTSAWVTAAAARMRRRDRILIETSFMKRFEAGTIRE
jgi:hypothetical protein